MVATDEPDATSRGAEVSGTKHLVHASCHGTGFSYQFDLADYSRNLLDVKLSSRGAETTKQMLEWRQIAVGPDATSQWQLSPMFMFLYGELVLAYRS